MPLEKRGWADTSREQSKGLSCPGERRFLAPGSSKQAVRIAGSNPGCCRRGAAGGDLLLQTQRGWGWGRTRLQGLRTLSESSSPCCEMGWPRSRRWQGQGQTVAVIHAQGQLGRRAAGRRGCSSAVSSEGSTASGLQTGAAEIHSIFFSFFFFFLAWMGINPRTCSHGPRLDTVSEIPSSERELAPETPWSESCRKSN